MKKLIIRDDKNRDVMQIGPRGKMAVARYPDMDEKIKDYISSVYYKMTKHNKQEIMDFLNYVGEENEFCS